MTNLGPSLTISGDVTSQEDMIVHGTVNGTIIMEQGALVVERTGTAAANVHGSTITVHGTASGELSASNRIELTETANVDGTITAPSLVLREGAVFNGSIDVRANDEGSVPARLRLAAPNTVQKVS
jgi:cytoskeletal protein CcmA (bactofilin family)